MLIELLLVLIELDELLDCEEVLIELLDVLIELADDSDEDEALDTLDELLDVLIELAELELLEDSSSMLKIANGSSCAQPTL